MSQLQVCAKCHMASLISRFKFVQVRQVFGIHDGKKPVFGRKQRWCVWCRQSNDGKWRYAK